MTIMKRKLTLLQKLQILYCFHWMDTRFEFCEVAAHPTWYLTHNQKQIDRRLAAFEAKMEDYRRKREEIFQQFQRAAEERLKQSQSENRF